ncbi:MAG: hypothetical protein ABSF74_06520 [Dehalococcoidia bacterium]|jgi:hypothetical protein
MKGVGIELPQSDFVEMKSAGIDVLAIEWGMEQDVNNVGAFLDRAQEAGLKVIMDGGFSYRAWGFTDDDWDRLPEGKHPVWQKNHVQNWVKALKDHPAIYAWDICNEFGENLPSGAGIKGSDWPAGMITAEQISQARADVLEVDPTRPVQVRMHGWDIGEMPSQVKSVLEDKTADIISLNLYSNYMQNGVLQWPDVIKEGGPYFVSSIKTMAMGTQVWLSIAAFEYHGQFGRPTPADVSRDLNYAKRILELDGISFFDWGPVNQWDSTSDWYLPQSGADLWAAIKTGIQEGR